MGQGNSNCIAGIVGKIAAIKAEKVLQRCSDLIFARMSLTGYAFLDMGGCKFGYLNLVAPNRCDKRAARFAESES